MENKDYVTLDEHLEEIKKSDPEHYNMIQEKYRNKVEKIKHGGSRQGAGRKKAAAKKVTVSVVLTPEVVQKIDDRRGNISRSRFINDILANNT